MTNAVVNTNGIICTLDKYGYTCCGNCDVEAHKCTDQVMKDAEIHNCERAMSFGSDCYCNYHADIMFR